jgi:hypothetical protein
MFVLAVQDHSWDRHGARRVTARAYVSDVCSVLAQGPFWGDDGASDVESVSS